MQPLHEYQRRCIEWMQQRDYGYLAVDMGLGKTRCIIEYAKLSGIPTVVVAPLRVAYNTWPTEIEKWWPEAAYTILHGDKKACRILAPNDFYITNYEGLNWLLHNRPRDEWNLVMDESTKIKNYKAAMTKQAIMLAPYAKTRWCLSATPFPQGLVDAWSQYRFLDNGVALGDKWFNFTKNYCQMDRFNKYYVARVAEDAVRAKIRPLTFRLDAKDYLSLPPLITDDRLMTLPDELYADYKRIHREMVMTIGETSIPLISAAGELSAVRQWLSGRVYCEMGEDYNTVHSLKLEMLDTVLEELGDEPALIAIAYRHELQELLVRYGNDLPYIAGGVYEETSRSRIDAWNAGKLPRLVVMPAACAHGINLQAGGRHIIWLSLTYNYEHYTQLIGRLHRQGQEKPVINHRLLFRNTIDMQVAKCLENKGSNLNLTLDYIRSTNPAAL